jgi:hypothetical protein
MNPWNIPEVLEREIKDRDRSCVYCRIEFGSSKEASRSLATWEHIVNEVRRVNRENIARCCRWCNSSKGTKDLSDWFECDYCKKRGITKDSVAEVVRMALVVQPNISDGAQQNSVKGKRASRLHLSASGWSRFLFLQSRAYCIARQFSERVASNPAG